jgi:hypothetical protein
MSRFISDLLTKEKNSIKAILSRLEMAAGEPDIDSRLTSEIIINSKRKLRELGLDPNDTTPEELSLALNNLVGLHDRFLAKSLGADNNDVVVDLLARITKFSNNIAKTKKVWGLKHSAAKRQLKAMPPKVLMKKLGYRSIDSMLKRESIDDLYAGIRVAEHEDYINKFFKSFKKLKPSDFESRKMIVHNLTQKKWSKASVDYVLKSKNNIIELKELGSIVVMPLPIEKLRGTTIMLLPLILHRLNEIHLYSSYFKYEQVQNDFSEVLVSALLDKPISSISMAGLELNWKVIIQYLSKLAGSGVNEVFEPHIQIDDLENDSVEESLYKLEPALHFWYGNDCLGLPYKNGIVSFNLMDAATNYVNTLGFGQNSTKYLKESLWDELLKRYLEKEPLQDQVLQQLDYQPRKVDYDEAGIIGSVFA